MWNSRRVCALVVAVVAGSGCQGLIEENVTVVVQGGGGGSGSGAASQLVFMVDPSDGTAGSAISPAVKVWLLDANGNLAVGATTAVTLTVVPVAPTQDPDSSLVQGTGPVTPVGGQATFDQLRIDAAGTYRLAASAQGLDVVTSASFTISAGAAAQLAVAAPDTASVKQTFSVAIQVEDTFGNPVDSLSGQQVTLALGTGSTDSPGLVLTGPADDPTIGGVATLSGASASFDVRIDRPGDSFRLVATATGGGAGEDTIAIQSATHRSSFSGQSAGGSAVATDVLGGIVTGGRFKDLNGEPFMLVTRFDSQGFFVWEANRDEPGDDLVNAVAIDPATDEVLFAGGLGLQFTVNDVLTQGSVLVEKLVGVPGASVWQVRSTVPPTAPAGENGGFAQALAVSPTGEVLIIGTFVGTVDLGGVTLTSKGEADIFFAKLDGRTGAVLWAEGVGEAATDDQGTAIAVEPGGTVLVAGQVGSLLALARLDGATGAGVTVTGFSQTGNAVASDLAVDASGDIFLIGAFDDILEFAGTPPLSSQGGRDIFVARLDAAFDGIWATRIGFEGDDFGTSLAIDPVTGDVLATGAVTFLVGSNTPLGRDIFVARLAALDGAISSTGTLVFGGSGDDQGNGIAVIGSDVLVTGTFQTTVDFGGDALTDASGQGDAFLLRNAAP